MSQEAQRVAQADERAKALARMSDTGMAAAYADILLDSRNLNFSPYLVSAMRNLGLWPRLQSALTKREEAASQ